MDKQNSGRRLGICGPIYAGRVPGKDYFFRHFFVMIPLFVTVFSR